MIEGLRRRQAHAGQRTALTRCDATGRTDGGSSLHAECVACGAVACDWRRLLGVGAGLAERVGEPENVVLTYPGACAECGGSTLVVSASALR